MLLLIDNYDSFTYNLVQYFRELGAELHVCRNDEISVEEARKLSPDAIVISPGPCTPKEAGISLSLISAFAPTIPILGVCLGHQSLAAAFGAEIVRASRIMHGKTSLVSHDGKGVFKGLPNPFEATRYHSLAVRRRTLPGCFEVTAESEDAEIMGIRHKEFPAEGLQFHPESILTVVGKTILSNFLG